MWQALIKLVEKLGCMHEWECWKDVYVESNGGYRYHVYHFVCKKCGKFKQIKSH